MKNRIIFLIFALLLSVTMARGQDFVVDGNGVLTQYNGSGGDVVIPDDLGITAIGDEVFYNNMNITSVVIPNGVTTIGQLAFRASGLNSATIPESVTTIGFHAFASTNISFIYIPKRVQSLGNYPFYQCHNLPSIDVDSDNVYYTSVDGVLFDKNMTTLIQFPAGKTVASYSVPEGVTSLGVQSFGESKISSVSLPSTLQRIEAQTFRTCVNLTSAIDIPASVNYIEEYAFIESPILTFNVDPSNNYYSAAEGVLFDKNKTTLMSYPGGKQSDTFVIPSSVTSINEYAFNEAQITNITVSSPINVIKRWTFTGCSKLRAITLPSSLTSIEMCAFQNCYDLTDVTVQSSTPPSTVEDAFWNVNLTNVILHVPAGTKALYEAADVWKDFGTIIEQAPTTIAVTGVSLNKHTITLPVDSIEQLIATILPDSATNKAVTWSSSNQTVASVSSNGIVTALAEGITIIRVITTDGNKVDSCQVTVNRILSNDATLANLTVSQGTLTPAFSPSVIAYTVEVGNQTDSIVIAATKNHVAASVSGTGTKSLSVGENIFDITVTAEDGTQIVYTVTVTRKAPVIIAVTRVSLNKTNVSLTIGATEQLTATVLPDSATNKAVTWSSSNQTVASVSSAGLITAVAEGTATITVTTADGGFTATCAVTVTRPLSNDATLAGLTINQGTLTPAFSPNITAYTVEVGNETGSIEITAVKNHADATIFGNGTYSLSIGENTFDITVTAEDGTQKVYTITVTREAPVIIAVTSVSLNKTSLSLSIGATEQLIATVLPDDATDQAVTWSSSNQAIASVSTDGIVTALAEGSAIIRVITTDGNKVDSCQVTVNRILSDDATLANLTVNQGTLTPAFSPTVTAYTVEVGNQTDSIAIAATANHAAASVSGTGMKALSIGENNFTITVTAENGDKKTYTVTVIRKAPDVTADEKKPVGADGTGTFELSLTVPANVLFSGSFMLTLPNGFHLDLTQTKLSDDLSGSLTLTFTQNADGSWLFTIGSGGLRSMTDNVYRKLVDIVYTIDESVNDGNYAAQIQDLSFTFEDNTRIEEAEIPVNVTVDHNYQGIPAVGSPVQVYAHKQVLYVNTPATERIHIYSLTGTLLSVVEKQAGKATFAVNRQGQVLIVKGSSGWVRKVMF